MKDLQIGDRVGFSHGNKSGVITDALYSNAKDKFIYQVHWDGDGMPSQSQYDTEDLYLIEDREYRYDISLHENVVVAVLYERINSADEKEVARGHGHIIHEGVLGFTQAASYALKKILLEVAGGDLPMRDGGYHNV